MGFSDKVAGAALDVDRGRSWLAFPRAAAGFAFVPPESRTRFGTRADDELEGFLLMTDGTFILNIPLETQLASPLTLVENWDKELKEK